MKSLQDEGFPLSVFQGYSANFDEVLVSSLLYQLASQIDKAELIVHVRMCWRVPPPTNIFKLFICGNLAGEIVIDAGNHGEFLDERKLAEQAEPAIALAHYPRRNWLAEPAQNRIGMDKDAGGR